MKKRLLMLVTAAFVAFGALVAMPKANVSADAYTNMNYDQIVDFWSAQPAFTSIFYQEAPKSQYVWNVKTNVKEYFKASLYDYCVHPGYLQSERPQTFAYMQGVVSYSNPYVIAEIACHDHAYTLQEALLDEMNRLAPYLSPQDKAENVGVLTGFLNHQGVYTVDQYNAWKNMNGGQTAFEVYCHQIKDASDAWTNAIKDASAAQNAYNQQVMEAAGQAQQELNQQLQDQMNAAMQQQQDMMNQMLGND